MIDFTNFTESQNLHSMKILGIIPSRYGSTRFPGKPLIDIKGKSMVQRVYEQASQASNITRLVVATDDERIFEHVQEFGEAVMTADDHPTGTDRCNEVLALMDEDFDAVINIQGDEPLIQPYHIDQLAELFDDEHVQIGTLYKKLSETDLLLNPSIIKVVVNMYDEALYFSRSPIPHFRNEPQEQWVKMHQYFQHIGIYGYRSDVLFEIAQLEPSYLEMAESLEQLRWMENGYTISVAQTDFESMSIDTPEDLERVLKFLE